jgi:hypothetical protein
LKILPLFLFADQKSGFGQGFFPGEAAPEAAPASNYFSHHPFLHHFGVEMVLLFPLRHSTNENHQLERTVLFEAVLG